MNFVNWGIVGTGRIAREFAETINHMPGTCLFAVSSRTPESSSTYAHQFGVQKTCADYEAMISESQVDAVYIATPRRRELKTE